MALKFAGISIAGPVNRLKAGFANVAINVRTYGSGWISLRNVLSAAILTIGAAVNSIARLNDSTPAGPSSGYSIISATTTGLLFCGSTEVASGLSGNQLSLVPFRPNASVRPWLYTGDSSEAVTITASSFACNGMLKVSSTGVCYKAGIKEPQVAPILGTGNSTFTRTAPLAATTLPWTTSQESGFSFGLTGAEGGTAPFIINVVNAASVTIAVTGSATINGNASATPSTSGPTTLAYPGHFTQQQTTGTVPDPTTAIVVGAFLDADGLTIIPHAVSPYAAVNPINIGAGGIFTVPANASSLQIGINSSSGTGTFGANSESFTVNYSVEIEGVSNVLSTLGSITAYYFNTYGNNNLTTDFIFKNPDDPGGSGPVETTSNAIGFTTGNSLIFDATITAGVPSIPGIGNDNVPVTWTQLNSDSTISGSKPVFSTALYSGGYRNFNVCVIGQLFVPVAGNYTFILTNKDDSIWGIEGATIVSVSGKNTNGGGVMACPLSTAGQTITVISGIPLLPSAYNGSGEDHDNSQTTAVINFATPGIKNFEIDWHYWYHTDRILLLMASPTPGADVLLIPPLPGNVRTGVVYWGKYRSSATGAQSNPGPASTSQTMPVISNTVAESWSSDPQVDKVDYYRQDEGLANPTYVATGPNDGLGSTTDGVIYNTAITDSLTDLAAASNPTMNYDDFEPVPSIDLPRAGTCNVSGGVIAWVSGDTFNVRWLAGTVIEIGSPTQLAYTLIARPTSTTSMTIPGVPDGTGLVWNIAQPILANQPLPYIAGPTDNVNMALGVGDPWRLGTLYGSKGNNLDSWNYDQDVTDPSEPLVNVALSGGRGVLFSIKRAWIVVTNTSGVTASVTGTLGSLFTLQTTSITRGLFIPRCLAVEGGGRIIFRVDDGVHLSPAGLGSKSITDLTLYPLFKHEGSTPAPVTRNGITVYPPDDSQPERQSIKIVNGFAYYDFLGTDGNEYTLVYDLEAGAWTLDQYAVGGTEPS